MSEPLVQLVDANDQPAGGASKADIFKDGLLHRIARIMLFDESGMVLIQKRLADKTLFPGCWDNSAAGHVDEGEDYLTAAKRELSEEIGVEADLKEASYYRAYSEDRNKRLDRFTKIYTATIAHDSKFSLQPQEVAEVKWVSVDSLLDLVSSQPQNVTDGLMQACERLFDEGNRA